jgi:ribosomal protein S6--L-glutamate ligase
MKLAVIHESPKITESSKQLLIEIKNMGHNAYYIRTSRLSVTITRKNIEFYYGPKKLNIDGGIIRNLGYIVSTEQLMKRIDVLEELYENNVILINSPKSILLARDKLKSLMKLKKYGILVPETTVVENPMEAIRITREWGEVVIKPLIGSLGLGSVRVSDPDIAYRVAKSILSVNQPVYIQKYVEKPHNRDIRIFVVGDEIIGSIYRTNLSGWKTNIAQGAIAQVLKPSPELIELSRKICSMLELDYAGIDLIESKEGYLVLEVNAAPLWKGLMNVTGVNPAKYIVEHLINKIKK